jgi:hypothetical protein
MKTGDKQQGEQKWNKLKGHGEDMKNNGWQQSDYTDK